MLLRDPEPVSTPLCLFQSFQWSQCARVSVHVCLTSVEAALQSLNAALRLTDARRTVSCLMVPELQLPEVFPSAADLYHNELQLLQRRAPQVRDTPEPQPQPRCCNVPLVSTRGRCSRRSSLLLWRCCQRWC